MNTTFEYFNMNTTDYLNTHTHRETKKNRRIQLRKKTVEFKWWQAV